MGQINELYQITPCDLLSRDSAFTVPCPSCPASRYLPTLVSYTGIFSLGTTFEF